MAYRVVSGQLMISPFHSRSREDLHGSMRIPSSSILGLSSLDTTM